MRLMLLAAVAGEHVLLIGPPGTAKSLLARRLRLAFRDAVYFERLLTQFSVPEDLFGPYMLTKLNEDRFVRRTVGYLPTADVAFLDEIFKANPAILNALLSILQERIFHNDSDEPEPHVPLKCLVGASNELPPPGELSALYDRFLVRCEAHYVDNFSALLLSGTEESPTLPQELSFTVEELAEISRQAAGVEIPPRVIELLSAFRTFAEGKKVPVSDRRWLKIRKLLRIAAFTQGRLRVAPVDCLLILPCVVPLSVDGSSNPTLREITSWLESRLFEATPQNAGQVEFHIGLWQAKLGTTLSSGRFDRTQIFGMKTQAEEWQHRAHAHRDELTFSLQNPAMLTSAWISQSMLAQVVERLSRTAAEFEPWVNQIDRIVAGFEDLLQRTDASTDPNGALLPTVSSLATVTYLDFTLPGNWSSRSPSTGAWSQIPPPAKGVRIAWDDSLHYRFQFNDSAATPMLLAHLMRDFGNRPQFRSLSLSKATINDLKGIRSATQLNELSIDSCTVSSLAGVETLLRLRRFSAVSCNQLTKIDELANCTDLRSVDLQATNVTSIQPIEHAPLLQSLSIADTPVTVLASLEFLPALESLNIDGLNVSDWRPLAHLSSCQNLSMRRARISDLKDIQAARELRSLALDSTGISTLVPLQGMPKLAILSIAQTAVAILDPLETLPSLSELNLSSTGVTDLTPLVRITSLRKLTMTQTTRVHDTEKTYLKAALPQCNVTW